MHREYACNWTGPKLLFLDNNENDADSFERGIHDNGQPVSIFNVKEKYNVTYTTK